MDRIIGRLRLDLRSADGHVLQRRQAGNSVMQGGAALIADLFRGAATTPINGMAVGLSSVPPAPPYDSVALTTTHPDGSPALTAAAFPLGPDAMTVEIMPRDFKVRVRVRGVIPATSAQNPDPASDFVSIGEAALGVLSADGESLARLYNRVVFEPVDKGRGQELALYWDIDFPFGS